MFLATIFLVLFCFFLLLATQYFHFSQLFCQFFKFLDFSSTSLGAGLCVFFFTLLDQIPSFTFIYLFSYLLQMFQKVLHMQAISSSAPVILPFIHHHHHHKHQGLDPLIRSVSRVTTALAKVSLVFQLSFFLVVCSDMISKGFGLVAFFASVKASSVCIHLSCLVCIQSAVHGVRSRLFCGHKECSLPEVSITSFLPLQFFVSVRLSESNFLTHIKM